MAHSCWLRCLFLTAVCIPLWIFGESATAQRSSAAIYLSFLDDKAMEDQQPVAGPADKLAERGVSAFQQGRFKDAVR